VQEQRRSETATAESDALIHDNIDLVGRVVQRVASMYPRHVDRQELWNAGALGLVEAARRFDPDPGIPFERYASIRVRGAIIDSTRTRDWASRSVRRRYRELSQAEEQLTEASGHAPSREALSELLGVGTDELEQIRARSEASVFLYLDHENGEDGLTLRESIIDVDATARPEMALEQREMLSSLREAVENLPGVHGDVIRRYYFEGELLQDIATELGVTQARVSQIRAEALNSLRAWFGSMYEGVPEVTDESPGKRARAAYISQMASHSTWRSRVDAHEVVAPSSATG
jgi:RNA polymerase sigma factor for flagellar operon FliA